MATPIQEAEKLISSGNTEKALQLLVKGTSGRFKRKFALLLNRLKGIEKRFHQGTLSEDNYQTEKNKVSVGLLVALQQYEAHLNGESVGTSPDTIKWAIVGVMVFIVGFLGVRYFMNPGCTDEGKTAIYVADFQKTEEDLFSKALVTSFRNKLNDSHYKISGVAYLDYEVENYDEVVKKAYFEKTCENKGVFLNGTWSRNEEYFNAHINFINLDLKVSGLKGQDKIILDSPDGVSFSIKEDADFLSKFVIGILKAYNGLPYEALKTFKEIEADSNVVISKEVKGYISFFKGSAYAMRGNKKKALQNYKEAEDLIPNLKTIIQTNKATSEKIENLMQTRPSLKPILIENLKLDSLLELDEELEQEVEEQNPFDTLNAIMELEKQMAEDWRTINQEDANALIGFMSTYQELSEAESFKNAQSQLAKLREEEAKLKERKFNSETEKEQKAWKEAERLNSYEAYQAYLSTYPEGVNAQDAKDRMDKIQKDQQAWNSAKEKNTKEAIAEYLNQYPAGIFVGEAKAMLAEFSNTAKSLDKIEDYQTVKLKDGKTWLAQNLNLEIQDSWCYEDDPANCKKYGRLYTWEAAKEACAQLGDGWRLPTDEEWTKMVDQYGGVGREAYQTLIEGGSTGFAALLGGKRSSNGSYNNLGTFGYYWSSTEFGSYYAWFYYFFDGKLWRDYNDRAYGRSVRCLQD